MTNWKQICAGFGMLAGWLLIAGCGGAGSGPERFQVSGEVNFDGNPVPSGTIVFTPEGDGPQGTAKIEDGKFDTSADGRGVVGGPHTVRISGFKSPSEAKVDDSGESVIPILFENYEEKVDLPKSASTQTFDVPASAADAKRRKPKKHTGP